MMVVLEWFSCTVVTPQLQAGSRKGLSPGCAHLHSEHSKPGAARAPNTLSLHHLPWTVGLLAASPFSRPHPSELEVRIKVYQLTY